MYFVKGVTSFTIFNAMTPNVILAREKSKSTLSAVFKDNFKMMLLPGSCYLFDKYVDKITQLTKKSEI